MDSTGRPKLMVTVGSRVHDEVLKLAESEEEEFLILRIYDYYAHSRFEATEVEQLRFELVRLKAKAPHEDLELHGLIQSLIELCEFAEAEAVKIEVIAD